MKKRISILLAAIMILCFPLSACSALQGKSAYEIACENGFAGTEQEWLDSLRGKDGSNAADTDIDIYDLFEAYLSEYPDATFTEFLQSFLVVGYSGTEYAAMKGIQSAVSVYSTFARKNPRPGQSSDYMAGGAGVVYKILEGYAYIITNYHVIYDRDSAASSGIAQTIEVYTYGHESTEKTVEAEFVGGSITKDIAIIKAAVSDFSSEIKAVQTADSGDIALGERVVAVGNPLGENISVSAGVISVDSEEIEMEALDSASKTIVLRVIRTDTPINSGNSGGGLYNIKGELVGIVNAKTVQDGVESMGYAIPINVAAGIADSVMKNESQKCLLGITVAVISTQTQFDAAKNRVEIVEVISVDSVTAGGLADGKLQKDDKLISMRINGGEAIPITRLFHLPDFLYKVCVGDTLYLEIERGGTVITVEMTAAAANFSPI